jgi:transposase
LLGGLRPLFPNIRTVIADAGHQSAELARHLLRQDAWKLQIVKRRQRAFKITGLTWIVERSFAWLGRNRRLNKDYEYCVQRPRKAQAPSASIPRSPFASIGIERPPQQVWFEHLSPATVS